MLRSQWTDPFGSYTEATVFCTAPSSDHSRRCKSAFAGRPTEVLRVSFSPLSFGSLPSQRPQNKRITFPFYDGSGRLAGPVTWNRNFREPRCRCCETGDASRRMDIPRFRMIRSAFRCACLSDEVRHSLILPRWFVAFLAHLSGPPCPHAAHVSLLLRVRTCKGYPLAKHFGCALRNHRSSSSEV